MDFIVNNLDSFFEITIQIVGVFSIIASMTPNENDNRIADQILNIVNVLGFNFGKAKNE